jgi:hypothetical protein
MPRIAIPVVGYLASLGALAQTQPPTPAQFQLAEHWPLLALLGTTLGCLLGIVGWVVSMNEKFLQKVDERVQSGVGARLGDHMRDEELKFQAILEAQHAMVDQLATLLHHLEERSTPGAGSAPVIPSFRQLTK